MADEENSESRDLSFLGFVIVSTLIVVGMALFIFSPWIIYIGILSLGLSKGFASYLALSLFWAFFVAVVVLSAIVNWLRKEKSGAPKNSGT